MRVAITYRKLVVAFAVLFAVLQIGARIHATASVDSPHHHDCAVCVVAQVAHSQMAVLPLPAYKPPVRRVSAPYYVRAFVFRVYGIPAGRAPPPRAPPAAFI